MTRLLALIPGGIGDQLLCFPMLESLQQQYPQAQVDVVVEVSAKAAYRVSPVVKQVLTYNFKGRNGPADWGNLIGCLREREYDALLSLDSGFFGGVLLWLTGVSTRVGYAKVPNAMLMTATVTAKSKQYAPQMYHDLLGGLTPRPPICPPLSIRIPSQDLDWAQSEQARLGTQSQGYVVLHGGTLSEQQVDGYTYPNANWQALIKGIQQRQPELLPVLVQSPGDRPWFKPLLESCPGLKVVLPEDVGKTAAFIAGSKQMISIDSDAMQLAIATGTSLMALFGPGEPHQKLPQDERFMALRSSTGKVSDIAPIQILEKIWGK